MKCFHKPLRKQEASLIQYVHTKHGKEIMRNQNDNNVVLYIPLKQQKLCTDSDMLLPYQKMCQY